MAKKQQVARTQGDPRIDEVEELVEAEDHVGSAVLLTQLAIDGEAHRQIRLARAAANWAS